MLPATGLRHQALAFLYLLLVGTSAVFSGFLLRDAYRLLLIRAEWNRYVIHANSLFATLIVVGIGGLVFLVAVEHYFRAAPDARIQFRRFVRILAYPLLAAGIAHWTHAGVAYHATQFVDGFRWAAGGAEIGLAGCLLYVWRRA